MPDWVDSDRQDSLLTDSMRRFLTDEEYREGLSPSYKSQLKGGIRERVQNGILDVHILMHRLDDEQLYEILFERFYEVLDEPRKGRHPIHYSVDDLVGLIYRLGLVAEGREPFDPTFEQAFRVWRADDPHAQANKMLSEIVRSGMENALQVHGESGDPQVSIGLENIRPLDDLAELPLSEVSTEGLKALLSAGEISTDEFADEVHRRRGNEGGRPNADGDVEDHYHEDSVFQPPDGDESDTNTGP